jgi:phosphonopyruvate decarboxylase
MTYEQLRPIGQAENEFINEKDLYRITKEIFRFDFVSGLPCGELRNFIVESGSDPEVVHVQTTNERESVGIAQGAWLSGKRPALYMQNSGLFEASNDIGSLLVPCKTPVLFIVSWRGAPGETATQHFYTGAATVPLLESFGMPYAVELTPDNIKNVKKEMDRSNLPGVILVKKEKFNESAVREILIDNQTIDNTVILQEPPSENFEFSREEILDMIISNLIKSDDAVISSTGLISRSIFHHHDGENQFYNAGAFGLTSVIGLGFAMNRPDVRTIIIEGDGSALTNVGALNVIGHFAPPNLLHIVLDNRSYGSCSGEQTYGSEKIPELAKVLGYKKISSVHSRSGISKALDEVNIVSHGPQMIHIRINATGRRDFKRPLDMSSVSERFRGYFNVKN